MQAAERRSWRDPRVLTVLLLVFVAGAFSGALGMRYGLHERIHPASPQTWNPKSSALFLDRCKKDLNLTPQQAEQMATILDDYKLYYETVQEQLADVRATGRTRIMDLLNPEQRKRFEHLLSEVPK